MRSRDHLIRSPSPVASATTTLMDERCWNQIVTSCTADDDEDNNPGTSGRVILMRMAPQLWQSNLGAVTRPPPSEPSSLDSIYIRNPNILPTKSLRHQGMTAAARKACKEARKSSTQRICALTAWSQLMSALKGQ